MTESEYCFWHDPAVAKERAEARKKAGRHRAKGRDPSFADRMVSRQFRTLEDMEALLEAIIQQTLKLENSVARSRAVGYLVGQWSRIHEVGELEKRLAALEQILVS